jgi:hypothetical protein
LALLAKLPIAVLAPKVELVLVPVPDAPEPPMPRMRLAVCGSADAADAIGGLRIGRDVVLHAAGAVRVELREVPRALGVGLVEKHVVDIDRRRIDELLLRDDGDRRAEVLELRVEPRAGERVEGLVTALVSDDLEGRELKGLFGG